MEHERTIIFKKKTRPGTISQQNVTKRLFRFVQMIKYFTRRKASRTWTFHSIEFVSTDFNEEEEEEEEEEESESWSDLRILKKKNKDLNGEGEDREEWRKGFKSVKLACRYRKKKRKKKKM